MISDLHPGSQFHHYQLLEQIGIGGQGVVWSAEDAQRQDVVAIKFNEVPEESQQQVDDAILEQELHRLIHLRHGHILPIHDYGISDQVRYLVSPYVAGGSLAEVMGRTRMRPSDAVRYASEIASALDFLHENHVIHRDLKPANVLLDLKQHAYLSDFGLARTISTTTQAMHTGRGTPPYSPPEQHKQLAITARSDLYSFGVMLYEMFTGQLPWNGEKILGVQQLYSKIEIPDPAEINADLPPQLKDILRQLTSSDPALRPLSAGEAINRIRHAFDMQNAPIEILSVVQEKFTTSQDAQIVLEQKLVDWKTKNKQTWLTPTRFAMVHLEQKRNPPPSMEGPLVQFLLYHSMVYGYQDGYWWLKTTDPRDQAAVSLALFERRNDVVSTRVFRYLFENQKVISLFRSKAASLSMLFLDLALQSKTPALSLQFLSLLQSMLPSTKEWNDTIIPPAYASQLGKMALQENELGTQALQLIGHIHSRTAVEFVTKHAAPDELSMLLSRIRDVAGGLPSSVHGGIRTQLFLEWANQQFTTQPARLVGGYITALLGSTLGIGLQIYLTYRLPNFLDLTRISSSLIQGLITGFVFSLGIFVSRLVVERFERVPFLWRFGVASILGTLGMSVGIFLFHVLVLGTVPSGLLIPLGCFIIACSFSLNGLIPWRLGKMMLSSVAIFGAILGTWWIHHMFSLSITQLTPLFHYDAQWSFVRIGMTMPCVALSMGIFANLARLDLHE
jgi:serine/threonine protein kinase